LDGAAASRLAPSGLEAVGGLLSPAEKELQMFSRIRDRIAKLEEQILPKRRVFVFFRVEEPDLPPYAEQPAAFKAEKGVGLRGTLVEVVFTFA
jgi:hypothetical protein